MAQGRTIDKSELDGETCIHCDHPFDENYVYWHAVRAVKKSDKTSILCCRECGNWTPMRFEVTADEGSANEG